MTCGDHLTNPGPLVQFVLRIATICHSLQASLGIPDSIGLFSPPDQPICQLIEVSVRTFYHGTANVYVPIREWNNGKHSRYENIYMLIEGIILLTGAIWIQALWVSLFIAQQSNTTLLFWCCSSDKIYQMRYVSKRMCLNEEAHPNQNQ